MLGNPPEITILLPRSKIERLEERKKRRAQITKVGEIAPFDLIGFHPWPDSEESNATIS